MSDKKTRSPFGKPLFPERKKRYEERQKRKKTSPHATQSGRPPRSLFGKRPRGWFGKRKRINRRMTGGQVVAAGYDK